MYTSHRYTNNIISISMILVENAQNLSLSQTLLRREFIKEKRKILVEILFSFFFSWSRYCFLLLFSWSRSCFFFTFSWSRSCLLFFCLFESAFSFFFSWILIFSLSKACLLSFCLKFFFYKIPIQTYWVSTDKLTHYSH